MNEIIQKLNQLSENKSIEEVLTFLASEYKGKVVFSTSFGLEDQAVTHLIAHNQIDIQIFTLDTGRMFSETYSVMERSREKYGNIFKVYFPDNQKVEELMTTKGAFSFYNSVDERKECCRIRKVEPLKRALKDNKVWITGLRSEQSENRSDLQHFEYDAANQIIKYNPLLDWTFEQVRQYVENQFIPYNALHDKGFVSIGCAPCTRAIHEGENFRAGRWWWEDNSKKECGLHHS